MESYGAVYQNEEDLQEDFDVIDELTEEELEEIVEEVILNLLDEGYSIDDVDLIFEDEEIYEEILSEATVTTSDARGTGTGSAAVTSGSGSRMAAASRLARMKAGQKIARQKARKEKVQAAVAKVKGAIKSGVESATSTARELVDKPARRYAADRGLIASKSGKTKLGTGETGQSGIKQKQQTSAGRREVRSAVASDIAQRAKEKLGRGVQKARTLGAGVASAAASAPEAARSAVRRGLRGAATAVSRGARNVARKLGEDVDAFDVVLEHLLDEGYANTEDQAIAIMANMSEEWRDEILEDLRGAITYNPNTPIGRLKRRIKGSTPQKREARTREYQGNKSDSAERFGGSQRAPYDDNRGDIPALRNR